MSYTDIISLNDAKTYLGVDDTSRDGEISRMIGSALSHLEIVTNIILFDRDKTYYYNDGCVRVHDYPINTAITGDVVVKQTYSIYSSASDNSITLSVGYIDPLEIPANVIEVGYAILECLFEGGKTSELSESVKIMLHSIKRHIL